MQLGEARDVGTESFPSRLGPAAGGRECNCSVLREGASQDKYEGR